jgi:GntR family transcriptional regulator/MocR family aminotransferase
MDLWSLTSNGSGKSPGYKNLAKGLVKAIETGQLSANAPLPPSRVLADNVGVSRDTVIRCYKHLQSLGYLETRGTSGTFVRQIGLPSSGADDEEPFEQKIDEKDLSTFAQKLGSSIKPHAMAPEFAVLNFGSVPPQSLPIRRWRELMQTRSQPASTRNLQYEMEVLGRAELRQALSGYVNRAKGLATSPSDIAVFHISFTAFSLICRLLLNTGDTIAIEEPGFGGIKNTAEYHDLKVFPLPVDEEGAIIDALERADVPPKLIYVTSNHQDPTGRTMSLPRRKQLIDWAHKNNAWILDDDYDGFFHYGKTLPTPLKSLDKDDRVLYFGTFWQLLYPLTTVGFLVVPKKLMPILWKAKIQTEGITETMPQLALADMLDSGFLQKHARKIENSFAIKRRALIFELKKTFGQKIVIDQQSGGITCLVTFKNWSVEHLLQAAREANLPLLGTSPNYIGKCTDGECLIYFPGLGTESEIKTMVQTFIRALPAVK